MKRIITLIIGLLLLGKLQAQVSYGIKAGLNIATLHFPADASSGIPKNKAGFNAGGFMLLPFFKNFILQPELLFSAQGANAVDNGILMKFIYDYISIPLLVKYQHVSGLFVEAGPQISFAVHVQLAGGGNSVNILSSASIPEYGLSFGTGYCKASKHIGFDARYNLGVNSVQKDIIGGKVKNSVFQLGLYYVFHVAKRK